MPRPLIFPAFLLGCTPSPHGEPVDGDTDPAGDIASACTTDAACDDGNPCNGAEICEADGTCAPGQPVACPDGEQCTVQQGAPVCDVVCDLPRAPVLAVLAQGEILPVRLPAGDASPIETAVVPPGPLDGPIPWTTDSDISAADHGAPLRVLARSLHPDCPEDDRFDHTWAVAPAYPPGADDPHHDGVPIDDSRVVGWATGVADRTLGEAVDEPWRDPARALGPATGGSSDILALGRGGQVTLTFDAPIVDRDGPDFAVYENGFDHTYLEYAYVEVSSDGRLFVRFDSAFLGTEPLGPFDLSDPTDSLGLAGRFLQGFGTPFDLSLLRWHPEVRRGLVDLRRITHVRLVDVVGDGSDLDSFGRPIYDPYPTTGSAGFDLDGVAVLHEADR